jgi:hypothetical protein
MTMQSALLVQQIEFLSAIKGMTWPNGAVVASTGKFELELLR